MSVYRFVDIPASVGHKVFLVDIPASVGHKVFLVNIPASVRHKVSPKLIFYFQNIEFDFVSSDYVGRVFYIGI